MEGKTFQRSALERAAFSIGSWGAVFGSLLIVIGVILIFIALGPLSPGGADFGTNGSIALIAFALLVVVPIGIITIFVARWMEQMALCQGSIEARLSASNLDLKP